MLARHTEPSRTDCLTFGSNARLVPGASLNNRSILCCSPQAPSLDKIGWLRIVQEAIARQSRSPAAKSRAHPLVLLVIRRGFGCGAISFAQRNLLILLSLFFLGPCARCPLSFSPISTVIWLERHCIPLMRQLILDLPTIYMHLFGFCLSLLFARLGLFPRQRRSRTQGCAAQCRAGRRRRLAFSKEAGYGSR